MDLNYFVRERTAIIRLFYDKGRVPFEQLKRDIEEEVPPWEPPPVDPDTYNGEPAYLEEFMRAEQTRELVGMMAVTLLSDTLKLYFAELERELRIRFVDPKERTALFKLGVVEAYRQILQQIMGDRFASCPVRFDVIEQVVLARNDFAHNDDIVSFNTRHNQRTLEKHPNPFFVSEYEGAEDDGVVRAFGMKIEVSRENLMEAIDEVEKLADWVQANDDAIWEWRRGLRDDASAGEPGTPHASASSSAS